MIIGCGWHMLGKDDRALEALLRVTKAPAGILSQSDHLSAILVAMPILRRQGKWSHIVQASDRAHELGDESWADPALPFMKGMALARLNQPAKAASSLEQAIQMNPGFVQAYREFDQVATELRDFERCRGMAQKLVDHGGLWVNCWQRPLHFYSGTEVTSAPWHDPQKFALVRLLEEHFDVIRRELEALSEGSKWGKVGSSHRGNENASHDADLVATGEWREVVLLGDSSSCNDNCAKCPETAKLLKSCPEASQCAELRLGESLFSRLLPGTHLRPHCGPSNMRLTCHLGLDIPEGCRITCGGVTRFWEEGKCVVFDDSFEHEVSHDGSDPRTVLLVNFWHPDIPPKRWQELMTELRGGSKLLV
eukprot:TRINITY_DN67270_c0_g1_i1.p1 TRINITY_DN67270_c0_g1~~TRINITY_DN67270_c0_g1_i1.p1  ORF type:complete len:385 (+),score=68.06 TRINITY_DN67270_c0_g1_i1:64-1155(+)